MSSAIPLVEITDHTDALRVGRPDDEVDPFHTIDFAGVCAHLVITLIMLPFTQQVQVKRGEQGSKGVGITQPGLSAIWLVNDQEIARNMLELGNDNLKKPFGRGTAHGMLRWRASFDLYKGCGFRGCLRQKCPNDQHRGALVFGQMWSQNLKGCAVSRMDQSIDFTIS